MAREYWVYFDCTRVMDNSYLMATVVCDSEKALSPIMKEVKDFNVVEDNQFVAIIECFKQAIEFLVRKDLHGKINISHQNKILMDWVQRGYSNLTYDEIFDDMYERLKELYLLNDQIYLGHIPGEKNMAKKYCKVANKKNKRKLERTLNKLVIDEEEMNNVAYRRDDKKVVNLHDFYKY